MVRANVLYDGCPLGPGTKRFIIGNALSADGGHDLWIGRGSGKGVGERGMYVYLWPGALEGWARLDIDVIKSDLDTCSVGRVDLFMQENNISYEALAIALSRARAEELGVQRDVLKLDCIGMRHKILALEETNTQSD